MGFEGGAALRSPCSEEEKKSPCSEENIIKDWNKHNEHEQVDLQLVCGQINEDLKDDRHHHHSLNDHRDQHSLDYDDGDNT